MEPFCGGCNSLDKVSNPRIGNDNNKYLIALLKYLQKNIPFNPPFIGEEKYKIIQKNKESFPEWLVGYVGFNLSFGAKFFGGYRRDKKGIRDYENEAKQNILAQQNLLIGIDFYCGDYTKLFIPRNSILYCDPPYKNTTKYKDIINYDVFYDWCIQKHKEGHKVFISEYFMPKEFTCIWEKEICSSLTQNTGGKKGIEKLFTL